MSRVVPDEEGAAEGKRRRKSGEATREARVASERTSGSFLPYDSEELDAAAADTSVVAWHTLTRSAAHVYRDWEHGPASEQSLPR